MHTMPRRIRSPRDQQRWDSVPRKIDGSTPLDRKRIYVNPSSYPNPNCNRSTNPNPEAQ